MKMKTIKRNLADIINHITIDRDHLVEGFHERIRILISAVKQVGVAIFTWKMSYILFIHYIHTRSKITCLQKCHVWKVKYFIIISMSSRYSVLTEGLMT